MEETDAPLLGGEPAADDARLGTNRVVIPERAKLEKPKFETFEIALQTGKRIAAFIRKEGRVRIEAGVRLLNAHPDETYSKPPAGAQVEYLQEFVLPEAHAKARRRQSPCPCCQFQSSKFARGIVAWFPDECVIRVIGRDCFARLSPEEHQKALRNYHQRQKTEKQIAALLRNIPLIGGVRDAIESNLDIARSLDRIRADILNALSKHDVRLWPMIRQGWLNTVKESRRNNVSPGRMTKTTITTKTKVAPVRGTQLIAPKTSLTFEDRLQQCISVLSTIEPTKEYYEKVEQSDDRERAKLARIIQNAFKTLKAIEKDMLDQLQFVDIITLKTIRSWSLREDAEADLFLELEDDDSVLLLGRGLGRYERIRIDGALRRRLESMTGISAKDIN
ncbi:hypothetical protein DLM45_15255 [Hyphomicrobium methylovorum]|uniref:hypothetical protein n=1 Tax=Hyphomicrobium methylovorum TaxID=84 RepID=UPI0015E72198|nr:hypothetical protein [Hyphomicrobium methylovorum]MBA2127568.1 hypothetical protein [Hyphomicrobium methylovorum]